MMQRGKGTVLGRGGKNPRRKGPLSGNVSLLVKNYLVKKKPQKKSQRDSQQQQKDDLRESRLVKTD